MSLFGALVQVVSMPVRAAVDVVHGEIPAKSVIEGLEKIRKELEES